MDNNVTKSEAKFFRPRYEKALSARENAQHIAFAPIVFQATRVLRDSGILEAIAYSGQLGLSLEEIVKNVKLPLYGVRVLLESGLSIGLVSIQNEKYFITKTGHFILYDELTKANMDFVHDVCYLGLYNLDKSIETGKPEGLKVLGEWSTIYEGLSQLPTQIQKSWFAFDHYYSDDAFPDALEAVFAKSPQRLLDVGGNTGKWAIHCTNYSPNIEVTIMDLPGQLSIAKEKINDLKLSNRVSFHQVNILDETQSFPKGHDAIWMSQFLDCFSEDEITSICKRCFDVLEEDGHLFIMEPFWDRQKYEVGAFCLQQTSLYFTAIANGNSQMYNSKIFIRCIEAAGFEIIEENDEIGLSHTLLIAKKKSIR